MKKQTIEVPEGITKLSQWKEFSDHLPGGKYILNKQITGCGATTYFLDESNPTPVILCSHRIELLECKAEAPRHVGKVHLFKTHEDRTKEDLETNMASLRFYLDRHSVDNPFGEKTTPPKILVTTDSLCHVISVLKDRGELDNYTVVSDECQCIFTDAAFKGSSVLNYLSSLSNVKEVVFLSATPYLEKYLDEIDGFKDLPYVELKWPSDSISVVQLAPYFVKSIQGALNEKITSYLRDGYFEENANSKATEAVFFINSVAAIIRSIQDNNLSSDQYNIICSKSNQQTRKKIEAEGLELGTAPKEGEPHRPITFVTKCAYEGVDFYNPNAYTYIFSNPNLQNLSVDLSIDLVQILGRQRLDSNPWKNYATIYYCCSRDSFVLTEEEFARHVHEKEEFTLEAIDAINNSKSQSNKTKWIDTFNSSHTREGYIRDYVGIVKDELTGEVSAVSNNLVKIAETRAWEIRSKIYNQKYNVLRNLQETGVILTQPDIEDINKYFLENKNFIARMRYYCSYKNKEHLTSSVVIPVKFHRYYRILGPEKIKALNYQESYIKSECDNIHSLETGNIISDIHKSFVLGDSTTKAKAKLIIQNIYDKYGVNKKAKATDLEDYFIIQDTNVIDNSGKRLKGFKILGKK